MLVSLARYHKSIAWFFVGLFYLELVLVPVAGRAEGVGPVSYRTTRTYGMDIPYLKNKSPWSTGTELSGGPNNLPLPSSPAYRVAISPIVTTAPFKAAAPSAADGTGPGQPEMSAFTSVSSANMVDLFSGDFSYNIPLLDVGGYPVNIAYRAGVTMDQDASWVGLGWNINPGTISRNMRGLPDDFNGLNDSVRKVMHIKENKTVGVTGGLDLEIAGFPTAAKGGQSVPPDTSKGAPPQGLSFSIGASLGIIHNNYRGWGLEHGINASINSGKFGKGSLTGGLSITNSSMDGLSMVPSLSARISKYHADQDATSTFSLSISQPYNTRSGLKELQLGLGASKSNGNKTDKHKGEERHNYGSTFTSYISYNTPGYTPTITIPYTSRQVSFKAKIGLEAKVVFPDFFLSGYIAKQFIANADTLLELPSYGYLHYQAGAQNNASLLDFNREKELPYREKPAVPHIAIPSYTYDAFSITGEGTGGMFRAYRGDIGFVHDHFIRTKDESDRLDVEMGFGDAFHGGFDLSINRVITQNGPWLNQNVLKQAIRFRKDSADFQAVYFRNPGEKSINDKQFYETLGGDDAVTVELSQPGGPNSGLINTTNYLRRYKGGRFNGKNLLNAQNTVKATRDKRTQVITYFTAQEAQEVGLAKYIEYHKLNEFDSASCVEPVLSIDSSTGSGLMGEYFKGTELKGKPAHIRLDPVIKFDWFKSPPTGLSNFPADKFSVRWTGRLKAPVTGSYIFYTTSDDGVRLWLNDTLVIDDWNKHRREDGERSDTVNLVAGKMYKVRLEYFDDGNVSYLMFEWKHKNAARQIVPQAFLYPPPAKDTFEHNYIVREQRVNRFRKSNHISEIDVLNNDGRRYVYGIPVYNLKQKETTFAVDGEHHRGNIETGLVSYRHDTDNTTRNRLGRDGYFNSEEVPAYAHSFLLTGILSADYSDITGNGISDDDIGDAVKFNYTKVAGIANPYQWRAPAVQDSVTFSEGLKTDYRDDKGNYIYGEKELWFMHSIESKTMLATFVLEDRDDLPAIGERGNIINSHIAKRLKEINLYSKSDFAAKRTNAKPIKTIHFEYSYELCKGAYGDTAKGKLTLKRIWFTYNGNKKGQQNPYIFSYNSNNPAYSLKSNDRWGNYKDPLQNPGSVAGSVITNAEYPYALQDSTTAAQNAAAWTLDSIYLPSGGSLKVQYESDDYAYVQNKRAMQMFRVIGTGKSANFNLCSSDLYTKIDSRLWDDHRYVFIRVPKPVNSRRELYHTYLAGIEKLYFKLNVAMPSDAYGGGYENIPVYADLDVDSNYGIINSQVIWVKLAGISLEGDQPGVRSPLVKAATQFLRLNLPSKAYPDSETGDNLDLGVAVNMLAAMATTITTAFRSFDSTVRDGPWTQGIDTVRSFVRLNNPYLKRMGGGHRVKRITVYDNWDKMAKKPGATPVRPAIYGQEYSYTTPWPLDRDSVVGSSGVAIWEPGIGGEENPFRVPVEYVEKIAPLGPVTLGYSEEPLGESFFPAANVGYSCVRVRTINYKNKKSANGFEETKFYTAYDYPIYVDRTFLDGDSKKRYIPTLANLLRVNAKHYLSLSQGFKVELNDMHGKMRSQASYAETDPRNYISYSEQFYKTDTSVPGFRRLANTVMVMKPDGSIDTSALIGKDVELMMDMREQLSITNGYNVPINSDYFTVPFVPPYFLLPTMLNLAQREENIYRSAATTKIIQRYGILDSAIQVDKGSRISTQDLMYDSETGDVLLTRTQNEFNDPVFNFTYPSHWAYDGMGLAYKNIDAVLHNVTIRDGLMVGMTDTMQKLFSSGDEILVAGKQQTSDLPGCDNDSIASFPDFDKIWAVDSSVLYGGARAIYFIDRWGKAYNGYKASLRIIRSGRRNILGAVGSVTSLDSLVRRINGKYELMINTGSKIIAASAGEFRQFWKTDEVMRKGKMVTCIPNPQPDGYVECVLSGGVYTGYQRIRHIDINPYSPSYEDTTWTVVENCYECPRPAKWVAQADTFQCAQDSAGNNLGFQYQGELDTASCSATYGKYRWQIVVPGKCVECPKPAKWQFMTGDSCEQVNGINTGYVMRKQFNAESCSSNPGAIRWIRDTANCTTCPKPIDWWKIDTFRCEMVGGVKTGYAEQLEINREPCLNNDSAGRWVKLPEKRCDLCGTPSNWQPIPGDSCQTIGGIKTGVRLKPQQNMATCNDSTGMVRWVPYGANCDSCKKTPNWQPIVGDSCQKIGGVKTGIRLKPQRNIESCSDSFNVIKWVQFGSICDSCKTDTLWRPVGSPRCEKVEDPSLQVQSNNALFVDTRPNTGWLEQQYVDSSICGSFSVKWVRTVQDTVTCPLPYTCNKGNCSGSDKRCINNVCSTGTKVWVCPRQAGPTEWYCRYVYVWGPGDSSDVYENPVSVTSNNACQMPSGCGDPPAASSYKKKQRSDQTYAINSKQSSQYIKPENNTDRFYKSVLPENLYVQYQQKRAGDVQKKESK